MTAERAPRGTYRLQLTPAFTFDDAAAHMGYLERLGVSHAYLSPITEAVCGSLHGYDVVDPGSLREELGGAAGFERLSAAARRHGLELLVDAVPNHMATDPANPWWHDVLEDGEQSPHADWFDVEWHGPDAELSGRVLVPILAESLDATLDAGEASLARVGGDIVLRVPGNDLPLALTSVASVIGAASVRSQSEALAEIGAEAMLMAAGTTPEARQVRRAARASLHARLERACSADASAADAIDERLAAVARDPRRLRAIIDVQAWVLDGWRQGSRRINYRRFFSISSLVAMRTELPEEREPGMSCALELVRSGAVGGLRIDHIDGLRDPVGWLTWLREAAAGPWTLVEKILGAHERLPGSWQAEGTTGYEFAALLVALSVDAHGASILEVLRDDVAGPRPEFAALARAAKLEFLAGELAPDWDRARRRLQVAAERDEALMQYPADLRELALREILVSLGVYRTYVRDDGTASPADRAEVAQAVSHASVEGRGLPRDLLELLGARLCGEGWGSRSRWPDLVAALQQLSPALMAKAVEDTALYRDVSLLARSEVGTDPDGPLAGPGEFHAWCLEAQRDRPAALLATTTHDTKRSEDVRARLCALSELAAWWAPKVGGWVTRHARLDPGGDAMNVLLQTLLGAWPIDADRAHAYLVKAMREAKERTSWTDPVEQYENALRAMVDGLLGDAGFVAELEEAVARVRPLGERVSLGWTLLRLTAPGVPDTYQGCELWDLSLVDPDNRRPVDFERRRLLLDRATAASARDLLAGREDGLPKLAVTMRGLDLRRRRPGLFGPLGAYRPLAVEGPFAGHCVAFARGEVPGAVTVVPRLPSAAEGGWRQTAVELPQGRWRDLLGGAEHDGGIAVDLDDLLGGFPVALLECVDPTAPGPVTP